MPSSENLAVVAPAPGPEMSATRTGFAQTLERDRLERRVSWMTVVVESLRRRASEQCIDVRETYRWWLDCARGRRGLAYAGYLAALAPWSTRS